MESQLLKFPAIPFCLIVFASVACSDSPSDGIPAFQVHDSSGVQVVWSGPANLEDADGWEVASDPILQIGDVEGDLPYLFERLSAALMVPDGRIVVADGRALDIRIFDSDGTHLKSFGRPGEGPEEFGGRPFLALIPPDTLLVWDSGNYRLSWFDLEGSLLKQRSLAPTVVGLSLDLGARAWSLTKDGFLLWTGPPLGGFGKGQLRITLIDEDGGVSHDFGDFPTFGSVPTSSRGISLLDPFEPSTEAALGAGPHRVAIASAEEWEIRFFDSNGEPSRILRAPISRVPVTSEIREARRSYFEDWVSQFRLPAGEGAEIDGRLPVPDSLPAIGDLIWDTEGNLWVGRREVDHQQTQQYDVFDEDGRWLSSVRIPTELGYLREIGDEHVLTAWNDDLGVSYLRVYRLEKNR